MFTHFHNRILNKNKLTNLQALEAYRWSLVLKNKELFKTFTDITDYININGTSINYNGKNTENNKYITGLYKNNYFLFMLRNNKGLSTDCIHFDYPFTTLSSIATPLQVILTDSKELPLYINIKFCDDTSQKIFNYRLKHNLNNVLQNNDIVSKYWRNYNRQERLYHSITFINDILKDYIYRKFSDTLNEYLNTLINIKINNRTYIYQFKNILLSLIHYPEDNTINIDNPTDISDYYYFRPHMYI